MNTAFRLTMITAGLAVATGCAGLQRSTPTAVRADMLVSTEWLAQHLDDPAVVILHVSPTRDLYDLEHIPGAQFVGWDEITVTRDGIPNELPSHEQLVAFVQRHGITPDKRLILCDEGVGILAARGWVTLDALGLSDRAALLDGGLVQWQEEGRPLTDEVLSVEPSDHVPGFHPEVFADIEDVQAVALGEMSQIRDSTLLLDARSPDEYTGEEPGHSIDRPGHIPGAQNLHSYDLIVSEEAPVLKSPWELERLFSDSGVDPDTPVIAHCRTGRSGSLLYFAAKYLGRDVRFYDGSYIEWSRDAGNPIVTGIE